MASSAEKRISAKMILDDTGFNASLKGVNAGLRGTKSELKLASEGIKSFGKDSERLTDVQASLTKQIELQSKKVDIYKQSIAKADAKLQDNIKTRDRLKQAVDEANKKYEEAVKTYGKESTEAKKAKEEVDKIGRAHV